MNYYTYKVTFKDLPGYFYYGSHKDDNKPYYGSPKTWRCFWKHFEPEVQVLQRYKTAREADASEKAIILATWKSKYSLNENAGGYFSEEVCRNNGRKTGPENGKKTGPANGKKTGSANAAANFTLEVCSGNGKKTGAANAITNLVPNCSNNGKNFPPEIRKANGAKTGKRILLVNISTNEKFEFPSAHEAARVLGLNPKHLSSVALGKLKQHKGYAAEYTP